MNPSFDATILAENPDAIVVLDPARIVLHWNAAAERIFGYTATEAIGHALCDLIVGPNQRDEFRRVLGDAETQGLCIDESVRRRKGGSCVQVSTSTKAVRTADGNLEYFLITAKDVTPLQVARDRKLVEAKFHDSLDHTPDAMLIVNVTGQVVMANTHAQQLFGYTHEAMVGQPVEMLIPERYRLAHRDRHIEFFDSTLTRDIGASLELFGRCRNGDEIPVEISLSPLETDEGIMLICAVRDTSERKRARAKADRKFRDLLESAPDAMVIVDEAGTILIVNSETARLFGWEPGELLGKPVEVLIPRRFRGIHPVHRKGFFADPSVRKMGAGLELFGLRKDNTEFPVEISLSPIATEDGVLVASTIRDASERREAEQILHETNRIKSEFLASMSHEVRTPLNGILGFSDLLGDPRVGTINEKQREYVDAIRDCGKHLLRLINDVLDLSKVEAGRMDVYAQPFSPHEAIESVLSVMRTAALRKQVQLHAPAVHAVETVTLDLQKFKQILFNLLSNAVKFTDAGGEVHVGLAAEGTELLLVSVCDTGIGIAPEERIHLFKPFRQLDGGLARNQEGTGLGLTLTRRLVELQGGSIQVESTPGVGSTFTVRLPLSVRSTRAAA